VIASGKQQWFLPVKLVDPFPSLAQTVPIWSPCFSELADNIVVIPVQFSSCNLRQNSTSYNQHKESFSAEK
jgi:hypothetical protein